MDAQLVYVRYTLKNTIVQNFESWKPNSNIDGISLLSLFKADDPSIRSSQKSTTWKLTEYVIGI